MSNDIILKTQGLTKEFLGFKAVSDVNLEVQRGSIHALIGPNGAGKTTVFNLLTKFHTPSSGKIWFKVLTASVISAAVANRLPGPGTVYLGQQLRFRAPVRPGDTVQATVTVKSVDTAKARAVLDTVCRVGTQVVIEGEATVMTTSSARRAAEATTPAPDSPAQPA